MKPLIIGTRGSPLALAQVEIIRGLLQKADPALTLETKIIKTSGDNFTNLSLIAGGGKGLFTKEIEEHLSQGEVDVAIHSMKDLPTMLPDGLIIGAVPPREDAHDIFISKKFQSIQELPNGARVATSSIRRRAQLLARRPDLRIEEIRGNVETRLRKLAENDTLDALILAAAGLRRLGLWRRFGNFLWQESPGAISPVPPAHADPVLARSGCSLDQAESVDDTGPTLSRRSSLRSPVGKSRSSFPADSLHSGQKFLLNRSP